MFFSSQATAGQCPAYLDHDFSKLLSKSSVNLCEAFAGKPMLIVNTASHCGYTPQFKGLEAVHAKYKARAWSSSALHRTTSTRKTRTRPRPPRPAS